MIRSDPEQGPVRAQPAAQLAWAVDLRPFRQGSAGVTVLTVKLGWCKTGRSVCIAQLCKKDL